jgi:hypothetical protein
MLPLSYPLPQQGPAYSYDPTPPDMPPPSDPETTPAAPVPVGCLHVSDFRGLEGVEFQQLVDLPPGRYELFSTPAPSADPEPEALRHLWQFNFCRTPYFRFLEIAQAVLALRAGTPWPPEG